MTVDKRGLAKRIGTPAMSIFEKMNRLAEAHGAINLGQGFPDFAAPAFLRDTLMEIVAAGNEQYAHPAGEPGLTEAIARSFGGKTGLLVDPQREVTVTCGCQEAIAATLLAVIDPGDEVVVFEPFFETYRLCIAMAGGVPRFVTLRPPEFALDEAALRAAFGPRTRAILVNTPHNPTGRVFSRSELGVIAQLCLERDAIALSDEVYEELVFEGIHLHIAAFDGMRERTVTVSSLGKTFSVTGWKIGWAIAPPRLTDGIRRAHQALAFSIAKPLQLSAIKAFSAPPAYFEELRAGYRRRRDLLGDGLQAVGFTIHRPAGTYFMLADASLLGLGDDDQVCDYLTRRVGVTAIPSSYLYENREEGRKLVRFAFCKSDALISEVVRKLSALASIATARLAVPSIS
jgi:aspartate/methionine/tyrosine aminotransferase